MAATFSASMAPYSSCPPAAAAIAVTQPWTLSSPSFSPQFLLPGPRSVTHSRRTLTLRCSNSGPGISTSAPVVVKKRKRYRKLYPGEAEGITEEMRFVAMRLRNIKGKYTHKPNRSSTSSGSESGGSDSETRDSATDEDGGGPVREEEAVGDDGGETWSPSVEGFVKYLVDSKLVFNTIERIVDESSDVACEYCSSSLFNLILHNTLLGA